MRLVWIEMMAQCFVLVCATAWLINCASGCLVSHWDSGCTSVQNIYIELYLVILKFDAILHSLRKNSWKASTSRV